jgi:hypothetical protein
VLAARRTGAAELGAVTGSTPWRDAGGNAIAHLGAWFARSPLGAARRGGAEHGLGQRRPLDRGVRLARVSRLSRVPW